MEILDNIIGQMDRVEEIKSKLFHVERIQLEVPNNGNNFYTNPETYGLFRSTGGSPLGVVGKDFDVLQPMFLFDNFVDSLMNTDADLSQIEYKELKGGSKIVISAPIAKFSYVNLRGLDDEMIMKINVETGYNGSYKRVVNLSLERMVCANGMKAWNTEFELGVKNTKNNKLKLNMIVNDIAKTINSGGEYKEFLHTLVNRKISNKEYNEYFKKVTGYDLKKYNDLAKQSQKIVDKINNSINREMLDGGASAWSLLNGITRYTNHEVKKTFAESQDYIYADSGMLLNEKAQKIAHEMFVM